MAYVNPSCLMLDPSGPGSIHVSIFPAFPSSVSTKVPCALLSQHYSVVSNPPPHPSAMHAEMPEYWVFPDRRSAVRLPRRHEQSPPQESFPPITFSVDGWPGVRVRDVLNHRVVVDRPYDTPMAHFGWRSTVVNLEVS